MLPLFRSDQVRQPTLKLVGDDGKHAAAALRLRVGELVQFTNGVGVTAIGKVVSTNNKNEVEFTLSDLTETVKPTPSITVAQAITKGDGALQAVELLVEVGVDRIIPWAASRSVVRWDAEKQTTAPRKWQAVAEAAAKQSRRVWFPEVTSMAGSVPEVLSYAQHSQIIVCDENADSGFTTPLNEQVLLIIGPEGSITPEELQEFKQAGASLVRMGETILRSRHAGIAAVAALLAQTSRWGAK